MEAGRNCHLLSTHTFFDVYSKLSIPIVAIEEQSMKFGVPADVPSFSVANREIAQAVAMEFIERGFDSLAYCGIPETPMTYWSRIREEDFRQVAGRNHVTCSVFHTRKSEEKSFRQQRHALMKWLQGLKKPVGLMACYDIRAIHILNACHELEINVPNDVAIIGSGNDEVLCELSMPSMSSVEQSGFTIGQKAAATLNLMLNGEEITLKSVVPHGGIVTRQSSDIWDIADTEVLSALGFIRDHACFGIHVYDVIRHVGLSRSSFEPKFRNTIGHSIHSEIKKVQVHRVLHLLRTTDLTLEQIASQTGFPHIQHMAKLVKKWIGRNPTQYRKENNR